MITRRHSISLVGASALGLATAPQAADNPKPQPADWNDPQFAEPYIDTDEWRDAPVHHRYVHGGFKGTDARFSLYFPPKEQYTGRFFQYLNPTTGTENYGPRPTGGNSPIGFSAASGAYFVESNMGRLDALPGNDPSIAYRTSAAVAKYARELAMQMYGGGRPFGYVYGGSGGGYKTISCMETTIGIWDGAVPFIIGSPMAIPNVYTVRAHAMRHLKGKFPAIVDAIDPGGSGDMYAGLDNDQRDALREATRFGFPPRTWAFYETLGGGGGGVGNNDPTYFDDFWKVPGYAGANPSAFLKSARIQHVTKVARVLSSDEADKAVPVAPSPAIGGGQSLAAPPVRIGLQMANMPKGDLEGARLIIKSGAAAGQSLGAGPSSGDVVLVTVGANTQFATGIKAGDEVQIDNSNALASEYYHRYQVPSEGHYPAWNQFRGPDGKPLYPQRPRLIAPITAEQGAGSVQSGKFHGKMIVVASLMDEAALPWNADTYHAMVKDAFGARIDDHFRHWYTDHALHGSQVSGKNNTRLIDYTGILQQALRDVSAWVEKGTAPPVSTSYKLVDDAQISIPPTAAARRGVQPVVTLTANGAARADVKVGQSVTFSGTVEAPPRTGQVVWADWDFEGEGDYPVKGEVKHSDASGAHATVTATYAFTKPGTYFVALRAASQRKADGTPYAQARNLARARVVVT